MPLVKLLIYPAPAGKTFGQAEFTILEEIGRIR
jgi:hypothetical protein